MQAYLKGHAIEYITDGQDVLDLPRKKTLETMLLFEDNTPTGKKAELVLDVNAKDTVAIQFPPDAIQTEVKRVRLIINTLGYDMLDQTGSIRGEKGNITYCVKDQNIK